MELCFKSRILRGDIYLLFPILVLEADCFLGFELERFFPLCEEEACEESSLLKVSSLGSAFYFIIMVACVLMAATITSELSFVATNGLSFRSSEKPCTMIGRSSSVLPLAFFLSDI